MNIYTKNLNRIEFLVTLACTGKCKHCSEGSHNTNGKFIDGSVAADVVQKITSKYKISSLMTFGGEPLLYWEQVCKIHEAAYKAGIQKRQLITNGYFTKDMDKMRFAVKELAKSGIGEIALSADAFHQETIPLEIVKEFALTVKKEGIMIKVHPAWIKSKDAVNPYNNSTRDIIKEFDKMGIESSPGNIIFPEGNALIYLKDYFDTNEKIINPYIENPEDIHAISIEPNGNVLGDNIYKTDILDILSGYKPC